MHLEIGMSEMGHSCIRSLVRSHRSFVYSLAHSLASERSWDEGKCWTNFQSAQYSCAIWEASFNADDSSQSFKETDVTGNDKTDFLNRPVLFNRFALSEIICWNTRSRINKASICTIFVSKGAFTLVFIMMMLSRYLEIDNEKS